MICNLCTSLVHLHAPVSIQGFIERIHAIALSFCDLNLVVVDLVGWILQCSSLKKKKMNLEFPCSSMKFQDPGD